MAKGWNARRRRAAAQAVAHAFLALPLLLGACVATPPPSPSDGAFAPQGSGGSPPAALPPADPAPQPQGPPPAGTVPAPPAAPSAEQPAPPTPLTKPEQLPAPEAGKAPPGPDPGTPPQSPATSPAAPRMVTTYYVLLDDGGSHGVRFGCNDSLMGVEHPAQDMDDPLPSAIGALLAEGNGSDRPGSGAAPGMHNALAGSQLKFLSGTFDGTTVTVYLAGTLSLGGVCDVPRVEAQLTQTAVAAVGAIRADIYVNGQPLGEALRLD